MESKLSSKRAVGLKESAQWQDLVLSFKEKSGSEILRTIMDLENPEAFVKSLSGVDFYWILKRVGPEDALPLLEMGTVRQWVHVLDLEIWKRDRIDSRALAEWFSRFLEAQPERLIKMIFTEEGEILGSFFAYRVMETISITKDEAYDVPEDYVTLDGTVYFKARDPEHLHMLTKFLKYMAMLDFERYFSFVLNYKGIIPSEAEEELYRLRNMRIAEYGFLPFEEAVAVYSPLPPERLLSQAGGPTRVEMDFVEELTLFPMSLVEYGKNLVPKVLGSFEDLSFRERMAIELASLVNQLISADARMPEDEKELKAYCEKAIRTLNLAFERFLKEGEQNLKKLLEEHHLITFFRVGVYLTMKLKWEFERWMKGAWFSMKGIDPMFFGERWGNELRGLTAKRPLYYCPGTGKDFREFEWIAELNQVAQDLKKVMVIDGLLDRFEKKVCLIDVREDKDFRAYIFTPFAKSYLSLKTDLEPLTKEEMLAFFAKLREGCNSKPYEIKQGQEDFLRFWSDIGSPSQEEAQELLGSTLREIYLEFEEEYMWVDQKDLEPRFCAHLIVREDE